ncbi:MAG: ATP-binding protein [Oscillospiraceae bacterium]|nr:ATP-binding protein [Oscillospiraceae bacterium]
MPNHAEHTISQDVTAIHDLEQRGILLDAVNNAAKVLLTADDDSFESSILTGMELMGRCVNADRVYIMKNEMIDGRLHFVYQYEWTSNLGKQGTHIGKGTKVPYAFDPEWAERFAQGECLNGPLHSLSQNLQSFFSRIEIKTVLVMPIFIREHFWGLASFSDCSNELYYSDEQINILRSGVLMIVSSLTRNEQTTESRHLAEKLKAIVSNYPGVICAADKDFNMTLFDGLLLPSLVDKDLFYENQSLEVALKKDEYKHILDKVRMTFTDGPQDWTFEANNKVIRMTTTPIYNDRGEVSGAMGRIDDVTEMTRLQAELEKALGDAQRANNAKSDFLANMSHEMRTPLNAVIGLSGLSLESGMLSEEDNSNIEKVYSAGTTLLNIVNDILDISKIEAGKLELVPVNYDVPSLINDTITQNILRIGDKPISFSLDISEKLFGRLYGDELRIKQIMNNLLSNAIKYTNSGTVELGVSSVRDGDKVWLTITVKDTGSGIREEDMADLFSDYAQMDIESNRKIEGTGLGLPITKRLVEIMEGTIGVESEYGKGSVFTVRLAQKYIDASIIGANVVENLKNFHYTDNKRDRNVRFTRISLPYARVLVVDDDATNLVVARGLMKPYEMQVDCVESGQQAIEAILAEEGRYNAVFMDHMMSGMDGIEAMLKIREIDSEYARKVPIIALTANATIGNEEMFLDKGFQAFLTKPIDIPRLDEVIRRWVRDKEKEKLMPADTKAPPADVSTGGGLPEIPGIDARKGLNIYVGDMDIYITVLRAYADNTPATVEQLRNVSAETLKEYAIKVHALKGSSANIGAENIRERAADMEAMAKAGDLDGVLKLNSDLLRDADILIDNVKAWLNNLDSQNAKPRMPAPDPAVLMQLRECLSEYDMSGIDDVMDVLDSYEYDNHADLIASLKNSIISSDFDDAIAMIDDIT